MTLEPNGLSCREELLKSISLLFIIIIIIIIIIIQFCVVRYFRLSLSNNFYYDILRLYNIVIPIINSVTSVNLKKTAMTSRNIVLKNNIRCSDQLCSSLWTSRFWFVVFERPQKKP